MREESVILLPATDGSWLPVSVDSRAAEELIRIRKEKAKLVAALQQIVDPIGHFRKVAETENRGLNGDYASLLSNSANYLKEIAEKALKEIRQDESPEHCTVAGTDSAHAVDGG